MRRTTKRPEDIKSIVDKVIGKIGKQQPGKKDEILGAWHRIAGDKASSHSRPVSIRRRILTIEIDSSTWMYELNLRKRGILKDIRKELGEDKVSDIRFRMGDVS